MSRLRAMTACAAAAFFLAAFPVCASPEDENARISQKAVERRQRVEFLSFFLKDPKEAQVPTASLAVQAYNRAVEYVKANDYDLAREALRESVTYDAQGWYAYELLGDIDYLQQQMSPAKEHYEKAFAIQPLEGLKKKIQKIREEMRVEKKLSTDRGKNFILKYRGEDQRFERFELRELLKDTYLQLAKDFGYYFKSPVTVLLYDQDEFTRVSKLPHWVAGAYDGKIRMPVYKKGFRQEDLEALTAHEMTHAFVGALSGGQAPVWINEGLAEVQESKVRGKEKIVLRAAVKTGQLFSFDHLTAETTVLGLKDPLRVALFYQQSQSIAEFMLERYRMFSIKKMLAEYGKRKNTDEAMRSALKISSARLEKEWLEWLPSHLD